MAVLMLFSDKLMQSVDIIKKRVNKKLKKLKVKVEIDIYRNNLKLFKEIV